MVAVITQGCQLKMKIRHVDWNTQKKCSESRNKQFDEIGETDAHPRSSEEGNMRNVKAGRLPACL